MTKTIDLTGQTFGQLTVLHRVDGSKPTQWHCRCSCGAEYDVNASNLKRGKSTQCHQCAVTQRAATRMKNHAHPKNLEHIAGKRFGQLTAVSYDRNKRRWLCRCDCGGSTMLNATELKTRTDCGCACAAAAAKRVKAGQSGLRHGTNVYGIKNIMDGKLRRTNSSGATGVRAREYKGYVAYTARIVVQSKEIYLGQFATKEAAIKARMEAEQKYFEPLIAKDQQEETNHDRKTPERPADL